MSKETTKKRKTSAKQRQKQKVMVTGGLAIVLIILIGVFLLVSCGSKYADVTSSTIFVLNNGKIVSTDVEAFDEAIYSRDELKDYMKDVIDTYNKENGRKSVKQKSFKVDENIATLVLEYADAKIFKDFTGIEIFVGTIAEALEAGYSFDGQFASVSDGIVECTSEKFIGDTDLKVVIIRANTTISVDGDILYLSTPNISAYTKNTVTMKENCSLLDLLAQKDTQEGSTMMDTENTEDSDSVVNEDELLMTEEETEVVFDFGDDTSDASQYSSVYTYIIFK